MRRELSEIRERQKRDEEQFHKAHCTMNPEEVWNAEYVIGMSAYKDRATLLALVDRMKPRIQNILHPKDCAVWKDSKAFWNSKTGEVKYEFVNKCDCGLSELLEELE